MQDGSTGKHVRTTTATKRRTGKNISATNPRALPAPTTIEPSRAGAQTTRSVGEATPGRDEGRRGWPCCMDQWKGRTHPYPVLGSCDADGLRASQLQHAVEDVDGNLDLGRPTLIGA